MKIEEIKEKLRELVPVFSVKVAPVYVILNWTWADRKDKPPYIPTSEDISKTLLDLIDGLSSDLKSDGTGGLDVYYLDPTAKNGRGEYGLTFVLDSKSYYS
jgi:hypothetical protein